MQSSCQYISIWDIDVPEGRPITWDHDAVVNLFIRMASPQTIYVIRDRHRYRLVKGLLGVRTKQHKGEPTVPAIVLEVEHLHKDLARIDQCLRRPDLPERKRAYYVRRRQVILDALYPWAEAGRGPGQARGEKARKKPSTPASGAGSKKARNP